MKTITFSLAILILLAACTTGTPAPLPTVAVLPSQTLVPNTALPTVVAAVPTEPATTAPTAESTTQAPSPLPSETDTETSTPTDTTVPSETPTPTHTPTRTPSPQPTLSPSLTITNTITPTPSPSFTPTQELGLLGELAALSQRATILPPEMLYNPPTLTALYIAGQSLSITQGAATSAALLPPTQAQVMTCGIQPPAALSAIFTADPGFANALGCPQISAPFPNVIAVQAFERGSMLYVQGSPNVIYMLTLDGRFRRFDDTWIAGVDPESGGETPPLGLIEPKRGFGKIWRTFPDVRSLLGWAINEESGATGSLLLFERGRALSVPQRAEIILMADDPGSLTGAWRGIPGAF